MSQQPQLAKPAPDYLSAEDAAEYSVLLLRELRRGLRAHYEPPTNLPRQILTLLTALNYQDERVERSREARHALALSVAGVLVVMVVWNLILFFY